MPDLGLLLLAPLAVAGLGRRKNWQKWTWPLAGVLLVVAVVSSGTALADTSVAMPQAGSPALGENVQSTGIVTATHIITYTYDRLTGAAYSTGEQFEHAYDAVGNRTALTETTLLAETAVTTYTYDAANRLLVSLSPGHLVTYGWDARGNLVSDGTFTYTYNSAGRMVRAAGVTVTVVYTYDAAGLRVAQSVDGDETTFAWDTALSLPQAMATSDEAIYLYGLDLIAQQQSNAWQYPLGDSLGSVRQWTDSGGVATYAGGYTPYGKMLWHTGNATSAWGYTGEWHDSNADTIYLRARWYTPREGRFTQKDPREGSLYLPMSHNAWLYVYANPTNLVDPLGYGWDEEAKENVRRLKQAFLDSAARHNQIPTMDTNGFAALIASTIVSERRIGNIPESDEDRSRQMQRLESAAVNLGCIVSGHFLKTVCRDEPDPGQCWAYIHNELPEGHPLVILASVGIGNVKLYTAANLWRGQACRVVWDEGEGTFVEECTPVEVGPLRQTKRFLWWEWEKDISNPFGEVCGDGVCESYDPAEVTAGYQTMAKQLLDEKTNIEYVAANLEAGALRALSLSLTPSAFNSASWHMAGLQTNKEIVEAGWDPGPAGPMLIVEEISTALDIWGLTSRWSLSESIEPQYYHWKTVYE